MTNAIDPMVQALQVLQEHWGHKKFRADQEAILPDVLSGEDVLAVLPTGGGKSVLFQVPAAMSEGSTIVVSPLIALMKDQVDDCNARGIPATYVNSHVDSAEVEERFADWVAGRYKLFYIAPERIRVHSFMAALQQADVRQVVVDEAHCAAQWGHDFRPAFMHIHEIVDVIVAATGKRPPVLAVTATATWEIEGQIAEALGMTDGYVRYIADPLRENLSYELHDKAMYGALKTIAADVGSKPGRFVVYCTSRQMCEDARTTLMQATGQPVGVYHAGFDQAAREEVQNDFKSGKLKVITATTAFGMGIDVPDIRAVYHLGIPDSLESYIQQAGRAGRDGLPARCVLFKDQKADQLQQFFLDNQNPGYSVFEKLWVWLHKELDDSSSTLRLSAREIAERISRSGSFKDRVSDGEIGTALNTMEAVGMVRREYAAEATPVSIDVAKIRAQYKTETRKPYRNAIRALAVKLGVDLAGSGGSSRVAGHIDKNALAKDAQMTGPVMSKVLKELDAVSVIDLGETFIGKTTQIAKYGAPIAQHLPVDEIKRKRQRALKRLEAMRTYASTYNAKQRADLVRDYFLGT